MLRPKKEDLTRKSSKQDALITSYVKVTTFYETNKRTISIVIAVVAVLIVAHAGVREEQGGQQREAR